MVSGVMTPPDQSSGVAPLAASSPPSPAPVFHCCIEHATTKDNPRASFTFLQLSPDAERLVAQELILRVRDPFVYGGRLSKHSAARRVRS
jgi:hypothetical protein